MSGQRVESVRAGGLEIPVERKRMKTIRLRLKGEQGVAVISAPRHVSLAALAAFAEQHVGWIDEQRRKLAERKKEPLLLYVDGERVFLWGREYRFRIEPGRGGARGLDRVRVDEEARELVLRIRSDADADARRRAMDAFYKGLVLAEAGRLRGGWEAALGVRASAFKARRMKTKWGSCAVRAKSILLNSELAKKPPECLEGVLVHELCHLIASDHGPRFRALMDQQLPDWRARKKLLDGKA